MFSKIRYIINPYVNLMFVISTNLSKYLHMYHEIGKSFVK